MLQSWIIISLLYFITLFANSPGTVYETYNNDNIHSKKKYIKEILNSQPEFVLYFNEFKLIDNRKEDTPVTKNKY